MPARDLLADPVWRRGFYRWLARARHARGCRASVWYCLLLAVWED